MARVVKYTARKSTASSNQGPPNASQSPFILPETRQSLPPETRQSLPPSRQILEPTRARPVVTQARSNLLPSVANTSDSRRPAQEPQSQRAPRIAQQPRASQEPRTMETTDDRRNGPTSRQSQQEVVNWTPRSSEPRSSTSQQVATSHDSSEIFVWDNDEIYASQSDEFICVRDHKYSARRPVNRETLTTLLTELSEDITGKLALDLLRNKRHAKRLYISCRNISHGQSHPSLNEFLFLVELPKDEPHILTWNQANTNDIEIQIIKRLISVPMSFIWQKVEAYLDCFITDSALKKAIASFEIVPRSRSSRSSAVVNDPRTSPRKKNNGRGDDDDEEPECLGVVAPKRK